MQDNTEVHKIHLDKDKHWKKHVAYRIKRYHKEKLFPYIRQNPRHCGILFSISFLAGVALFLIILRILSNGLSISFSQKPSSTALIAYENNRDHVFDPYMLTQKIKHGDTDFVLVDIRSAKEFNTSHIKSSVNIPAYTSVEKMDTGTENSQQIIKSFRSVARKNAIIIVYGPTSFSQVTQNVVDLANKNHIKAMRLGVGWSEFRYFRNFWVPESAWDTVDVNEFVVDGKH